MEASKSSVNYLFKKEVTKLNHNLIPPGIHGSARYMAEVQEQVSSLIDKIGKLSSHTQGLNKVITSGHKMRQSEKYTLYLLTDPSGEGGMGEVVGLLKVGPKLLYLQCPNNVTVRVEPLCVLDFYIEQSRQGRGLGKKLFNYMLQDTNVPVQHLAIDGPSPAMLSFLDRTYGIKEVIKNVNNFAVAPAFYEDIDNISSRCPAAAPAPSGSGRYSAPRPQSGISQVIHGGFDPNKEASPISMSPVDEDEDEGPAAESRRAPPSPVETEAGDVTPPPAAERPSSLLVETAPGAAPEAATPSPAGSTVSRRDSQLTEKGYFDVKFYHNKLW